MHILRLRPNTAKADYQRTVTKAREFLEERKQVRLVVFLRGRQKGNPEQGITLLNQVIDDLQEYGVPAKEPTVKNLSVTFNPTKRKN